MIVVSHGIPANCDDATLGWMQESGLDLPGLLLDAGLWLSADALVLHKYSGRIPPHERGWTIILPRRRERADAWPNRLSAYGGVFERLALKPYGFLTKHKQAFTIFAGVITRRGFDPNAVGYYDDEPFCGGIVNTDEIWWATAFTPFAPHSTKRKGRKDVP